MELLYVILIFVAITFIGLTFLYWGNNNIDKLILTQYVNSLMILSTFVALFSLIITNRFYSLNSKKLELSNVLHNFENSYMGLEKLFMEYYPYSIDLYQQIYNNYKFIQDINCDEMNMDINKKKMINSHLSSIIFQNIENTIINLESINSDEKNLFDELHNKWYKIWSNWFNSSILKNEWKYKKDFYSDKTQKIVDDIINKTNPSKNIFS